MFEEVFSIHYCSAHLVIPQVQDFRQKLVCHCRPSQVLRPYWHSPSLLRQKKLDPHPSHAGLFRNEILATVLTI